MESSWTTQVPWEAASNTGTWSTPGQRLRLRRLALLLLELLMRTVLQEVVEESILSKRATGGTSPEYVA